MGSFNINEFFHILSKQEERKKPYISLLTVNVTVMPCQLPSSASFKNGRISDRIRCEILMRHSSMCIVIAARVNVLYFYAPFFVVVVIVMCVRAYKRQQSQNNNWDTLERKIENAEYIL